jgi:hypothetical protein
MNNKFINNIEYNEFYHKYKYMISGLRTTEDCYLMLEKLESIIDKSKKSLLISLFDGKRMEQCIDYYMMIEIIKNLNSCKYKEEIYADFPKLFKMTTNLSQIKTFNRIAKSKPPRPMHEMMAGNYKIYKPRGEFVKKICPHCSHLCSASKFTEYIICGYSEIGGFNWIGCGKDWCFKCGKILCKSFRHDVLWVEEYRYHDGECCKIHAKQNAKNYPEDYCQCNNEFVKRGIIMEKDIKK